MSDDNQDLLLMTAELIKSYISGNTVSPDALPGLIKELHQRLVNLNSPEAEAVLNPPYHSAGRSRMIRSSASNAAKVTRCLNGI